jgi:hypothetical protein
LACRVGRFGGARRGRDAEELMEHWQKYASPALADGLEKYQGALAHDYDCRLNGADAKP